MKLAAFFLLTALASAQTQLTLTAPPPPSVTSGSGNAIGAIGQSPVYYWVIARYAAGVSVPLGPIQVNNTVGVANFTSSNYVILNWTAMAGATGYDVLRASTSIYPASPTCASCAVVVNTASTNFTDQGAATFAYPNGAPNPAPGAVTSFYLNNRDLDIPWIQVSTNYGGTTNVSAWIQYVIAAPSGACTNGAFPLRYVIGTSNLYACSGGTWSLISGGGGSGDVSGGSNLVTTGAIPYVSAPATLNEDTAIVRIGAGIFGTSQARVSGNGAVSIAPLLGSGTWFTGGSATTTKPYLLVEPAGTTSTGWSTAGTGIGVNAPSGFAGNILDLQVAGVSKGKMAGDGTFTVAGPLVVDGGAGDNYVLISGDTSGSLTIKAAAVAGSGVLRFPNGSTDFTATGAGFVKQASTGAALTVAALAASDIPAVPLSSGTSVTLSAPSGFYVCTSTCTVTLPVPAAGYQFCVFNGDNVSTVITLAALGSSARYENTARTAYGTAGTGTLVSGGAAADKVCVLGLDSTHYLTVGYQGTWTAN